VPGPLDFCKTPTPAGPTPLPYPNFAMPTQASGGTCSSKVKIVGKKAIVKGSEITMSTGDEGGVAGGGVTSNQFKGPVSYKMGSSKVKAEGKPIAHLTSMTGHNGNNANMPAGVQVAPSQTKVILGP
jgi:uncharacterized Zn-binding protein involved in type VI secretion